MIFKKEKLIPLPTTQEAMDSFVKTIVQKYKLPDTNDTYESIANLIMHMNQSVSAAPYKYFADSVLKSMANAIAWDNLVRFKHLRDEKEKKQKEEEEIKKSQETSLPTDQICGVSIQDQAV